jgi:hypothetical protein
MTYERGETQVERSRHRPIPPILPGDSHVISRSPVPIFSSPSDLGQNAGICYKSPASSWYIVIVGRKHLVAGLACRRASRDEHDEQARRLTGGRADVRATDPALDHLRERLL